MTESRKSRKNPNEIKKLSGESYDVLKKFMKEQTDELVQIGPQKYLEFDFYKKYAENIYNFEVTKDDIWVVTLPRSGTTLTQEMVWQISTNLDFETGFKIPLVERYAFFEISAISKGDKIEKLLIENKDNPAKCSSIKRIFTPIWEQTQKSGRRFFKSHLALSLLPPELLTSGCKVVYVARNPKDQAVSRYHFYKMNGKPISENFEDYWNFTEQSLMTCYPYFGHIQEAWEQRNNENLLFLFYEDIVKDLKGSITKVSAFLGKQLTESQINQLAEHLKVENFKKNVSVNKDYADYFPPAEENFVRKGKVGSWKELFTKELSDRADLWIKKQYEKTDMRFPSFY